MRPLLVCVVGLQKRINYIKKCHSQRVVVFQLPELYKMMYMAITKDRVDFVRLLLQKGVTLRSFLTVPRLLKLYNDVC